MSNVINNVDFQQILKNPILDIAAHFWEDERYDAFKICYKSMRVVDILLNLIVSSEQKLHTLEPVLWL